MTCGNTGITIWCWDTCHWPWRERRFETQCAPASLLRFLGLMARMLGEDSLSSSMVSLQWRCGAERVSPSDCLEQKRLRTSDDSPQPAMPRLSSSSILNGKVVYVDSHCVWQKPSGDTTSVLHSFFKKKKTDGTAATQFIPFRWVDLSDPTHVPIYLEGFCHQDPSFLRRRGVGIFNDAASSIRAPVRVQKSRPRQV